MDERHCDLCGRLIIVCAGCGRPAAECPSPNCPECETKFVSR